MAVGKRRYDFCALSCVKLRGKEQEEVGRLKGQCVDTSLRSGVRRQRVKARLDPEIAG